ncbi:hypothetical protein SAMN05660690_0645 [Geodermatophilus telluris]|uniref:Uncharacterized protein n=1 Tax=Geodermatophilus telluris TaxID=1190417 RepID=A0A1G6J3I9_9ACTN|nr:hypothetical protein [Geodermatophilus telluris]SDC13260.1 hypothetical protein SAMN05660690_0645 [Geodermatophilus telluris]
MAHPRNDPETGGRPLADILREAGIEAPRSVRRRRGEDTGETPIRQRRRESDTDAGRPNPGRRLGDTGRVSETGRLSRDTGRVADPPRPVRADRGTGRVPQDTGRVPDDTGRVPQDTGRVSRDTGRVAGRAPRGAAAATGAAEPSTAAIPGLRPTGGKPGVPGAPAAAPATGPIPVTRGDEATLLEDEPLGAKEGVVAWLRFAGELVLALAAGVGIYFLSTVVWEQVPQVAVVLAPLAVTGLVAAVAAWRQRTGREPIGVRLVAVLVFAGTLLTIAPAAGLLAAAT